MNNTYNPNEFIESLLKRINKDNIPACPYCGGNQFTTTESFASILIGKNLDSVNIGPTIPAGMMICEKCGHIDFFALGVHEMLPKKED